MKTLCWVITKGGYRTTFLGLKTSLSMKEFLPGTALVGCAWMLPMLGSSLLFVFLLILLSPVSLAKGFTSGVREELPAL